MKRKSWYLAGILGGACLFCCLIIGFLNGRTTEGTKTAVRIGLLLYRGDDTFISTLKSSIEDRAKIFERDTGIKVTLDLMDAKGSQNTQNNQVDRLISLGCDALCVNIVDRYAASVIIDKAMSADIPVVFFNREPVEEDMNRWEKLYYVGVDAKESARLQGEAVVRLYEETPQALDSNGDGLVSYVLLEGESSHQDSLIRTEWSIQTLKDGGINLEKLAGGIANWDRSQASAMMEQWLMQYPGQIELAVCNNDDMALGALDALERSGNLANTTRVVGIDATPVGIEALSGGRLLATVEANRREYAKTIFDIAAGLSLDEGIDEIPLEKGKYHWCTQRALTQSDVK